ncbi:unnamed protein product [Amoebophrya sp. A120]|nr:unnamed protein product [Amoebophrya sp. A120]|eukprot:GSA120T00022828001.1
MEVKKKQDDEEAATISRMEFGGSGPSFLSSSHSFTVHSERENKRHGVKANMTASMLTRSSTSLWRSSTSAAARLARRRMLQVKTRRPTPLQRRGNNINTKETSNATPMCRVLLVCKRPQIRVPGLSRQAKIDPSSSSAFVSRSATSRKKIFIGSLPKSQNIKVLPATQAQPTRPNIKFVDSDEMRFSPALSCSGNASATRQICSTGADLDHIIGGLLSRQQGNTRTPPAARGAFSSTRKRRASRPVGRRLRTATHSGLVQQIRPSSRLIRYMLSCGSLMSSPTGALHLDRGNCDVSEWAEWGDCSATCGSAAHTRTRAIVGVDTGDCPSLTQTEACPAQSECAAHCEVSQWTDWSPCNQMCECTRRRDVLKGPGPTGAEATNCEVSQWSTWGLCSATCGESVRSRRRTMVTAPQNEGAACPDLLESEQCSVPDCFAQGTISAEALASSQANSINPLVLLLLSVGIALLFIIALLLLFPTAVQSKTGLPPDQISDPAAPKPPRGEGESGDPAEEAGEDGNPAGEESGTGKPFGGAASENAGNDGSAATVREAASEDSSGPKKRFVARRDTGDEGPMRVNQGGRSSRGVSQISGGADTEAAPGAAEVEPKSLEGTAEAEDSSSSSEQVPTRGARMAPILEEDARETLSWDASEEEQRQRTGQQPLLYYPAPASSNSNMSSRQRKQKQVSFVDNSAKATSASGAVSESKKAVAYGWLRR